VLLQVLERMDQGIGNITNALMAANLWDNTLIFFMADNGGTGDSNNYPLRGAKFSTWEGGLRVASGISGGVVPKNVRGTTFDGLLHVSDWYPTLCRLVGGTEAYCKDDPTNVDPSHWFWPLDGVDVWPFITQGASDPRSGIPVVLASPGLNRMASSVGGAMILGKYKIVYEAKQAGWDQPPDAKENNPEIKGNSTCVDGTKDKKCKVCSMEKPCLFDVWADDAEVYNLAEKMPQLVQQMNKTYTRLVFEMRQPAPYNFTQENGWVCQRLKTPCLPEDHWGCYIGPDCWCPHSEDDCKVGPKSQSDEFAFVV